MSPHPLLKVVHDRFSRRLDRLEALVFEFYANVNTPEGRRLAAYVSLEAMNAWESFAKAFFLSCAMGARTAGGVPVRSTLAFSTVAYAMAEARRRLPRGLTGPFGPQWKKLQTVDELGIVFSFSNYGSIQLAVAYQTNAIDELNSVRNYFAHKCEDTRLRALAVSSSYSLVNIQSVYELLCQTTGPASKGLLVDWLDDQRVLARLACT